MSPTQRSIAKLKADGWPFVRVVEKWVPQARRRVDLWGADIIALKNNQTLLVQTTTGSNAAARLNKLREEFSEPIICWLSQPNHEFHVHGWARRGPRGKRKLWTVRRVSLVVDNATGYIGAVELNDSDPRASGVPR